MTPFRCYSCKHNEDDYPFCIARNMDKTTAYQVDRTKQVRDCPKAEK